MSKFLVTMMALALTIAAQAQQYDDIMNGLLYLPTGVGDEKRPSILYVWDLRTRTMRNVVNLQEAIPVEMEDCAPYAGTMMVQCQRCLYQIRF
jgi:hypothetical protein